MITVIHKSKWEIFMDPKTAVGLDFLCEWRYGCQIYYMTTYTYKFTIE